MQRTEKIVETPEPPRVHVRPVRRRCLISQPTKRISERKVAPTCWIRAEVASIVDDPATCPPVIEGMPRLLPGIDFWDLWPVRTPDGAIATVCRAHMWAGLSAPATGHPGARHDIARIRLFMAGQDLRPLFPDVASVGSREWAGSLVFDAEAGRISAYYTAAGERGEAFPTYRQRIFGASAQLGCPAGRPEITDWSEHRELVVADAKRYLLADDAAGEPGFIKAFRDPFFFRDPVSGRAYLLFTGSMAEATTDYNGCIGIARSESDDWVLLDPLITADGVNNELERPHVVVYRGLFYLFFSTQARTFHPEAPGPTGLYGFVAPSLFGPYQPLNGSGLVVRNPAAEPFQAYSWLVLNDLRTVSFVDFFGLNGRHPDDLDKDGPDQVRRHFGGTMAPMVQLLLDGDHAGIA